MRRRISLWVGVVMVMIVGAVISWRIHNQGQKAGVRSQESGVRSQKAEARRRSTPARPVRSQRAEGNGVGTLNQPPVPAPRAESKMSQFKNRLSNTSSTVGQLAKKENAILLANALLDTDKPIALNIPDHLRSEGEPGSYVVQSRGPIDAAFREALKQTGATIVSYIPNNAFLVRASAQQLAGLPNTQIVLPYEPFYKVPSLLNAAVDQQPLPENSALNLLLFADAKEDTLKQLQKLGVEVLGEDRSPFGPVVKVRPPQDWVSVVRLSGVQTVELAASRVRANDLSRVRLRVATDTTVATNYLGLDGAGVMVNVNDTGVDATHPDLLNRVFGDFPSSLSDTNGHGTHVAGIIASSGNSSTNPVNVGAMASGSVSNATFRGVAPAASIFSMGSDLAFGPASDAYLQERAAHTNVFISNNSWHYFADTAYDLAAASYDAAVRDALPEETGSHPLLYVFAAGNSGGGGEDGSAGIPGTIQSPATAKNVITVGAIEQNRSITNETEIRLPSSTNTSTPWMASTDSSNQVASFSSRGNVGVGLEGDNGRFKPDVVAPGTFVVSTTRKDHWDQVSYYNPTNYHESFFDGQTVGTNTLEPYSIFVPFNAVQLVISVFAGVDLPIYVKQATVPTTNSFDLLGTNTVSLPPDHALTPVDVDWNYAIGNHSGSRVTFGLDTLLVTTNDNGNYLTVLSNLNDTLGPYYRYESGTSMSAADVSGMLALMQQHFEQHLHLTNSPALMKALLINGARPVSDSYHPQLRTTSANSAGWGLPSLPTTVITNANEGSGTSMLFFDQHPTNALATGQSRTYTINVSSNAPDSGLQVTLVWTDPPGNPVASTKLVNDLDLVITNLDTKEVFFGNDIPIGGDFTQAWDTNGPPNVDVINNVENIFLSPPLGSGYSVTVVGRRVNVNAVTAHTNDVTQDFALVISCGDGEAPTALSLAANGVSSLTSSNTPLITILTNSFVGDPQNFGGFVMNQHAGGNTPLLGTNTLLLPQYNGQLTIGVTNQWHFYLFTNTTSFTNAAFLTFIPPTLSVPRMGVRETDQDNATRIESDLDLYVSRDHDLTNLTVAALTNAIKSIGRGGTETVVISNAVPGLYYVAVKSEAQEGAEYGFLGTFSEEPFSTTDANGNLTLRGFPRNAIIPDGSPDRPAGTMIFAVAPQPIQIKRVVVTNTISHQNMGDLFGNLRHTVGSVVLNNHSGSGPVTNLAFVYNDSDNHDIPNGRHTDGPGTLTDFGGSQGAGQWILTEVDNTPGNAGTNVNLTIWLEKQKDPLLGITETLAPGECSDDFLFVPLAATNLTVVGTILSGAGPVSMEVCPLGASGSDCQSTLLGPIGSTNTIVIDKTSNPPLNSGLYVLRFCNLGTADVTINFRATLLLDVRGVVPVNYQAGPVPIKDDAVTYSTITVPDDEKIAALEVGVRIDHPRVSDLVLHLIGPDGTRLLLDENRGALTTNGMGADSFSTNIIPVNSNGDWRASTNVIDVGLVPTSVRIDWDMFGVPDWMHVYYNNVLIMDTGVYANQGTTNLLLAGPSTLLTIVMNEGGNTNAVGRTAWRYTVTSTAANYIYTVFTENTNRTITPIKFAIPPFVPTNATSVVAVSTFDLAAQDVSTPSSVNGWLVRSNMVSVINDPGLAFSGSGLLALGSGSLSRTLATVPGQQYTLTYRYRGPGIVGWWRGENNFVDSVAGRNGTPQHMSFTPGEVNQAFVCNPSGPTCRVVMADDPAFALTNSLSIDAWIKPIAGYTVLWRGDDRAGFDPYALSMGNDGSIYFFVEDAVGGQAIVGAPLTMNQWAHVAGTLDGNTGALKIYVNGALINQITTAMRPFGPLISGRNDSLCIGNVGNPIDFPFVGNIDEPSLYGRALSASEVRAIYAAGSAGKFDPTTNAPQNLAKMRVTVDGTTNVVYGQNTNWTLGTITFTATQSSTPLLVDGLEPGMLIDEFTLTGSGGQSLYYLPEDSTGLDVFKNKSAQGDWTLEVWDNRVGATNPTPMLRSWQLSFVYATSRPLPISLIHDETVTNSIPPGQFQYYAITVPSWASFATNQLLTASAPVNVWFNPAVPPVGGPLPDQDIMPAAGSGSSFTLVTNGAPPLVRGSTYYIGIENPGATSVTVSFKVDFDVTPLTLNVPIASQEGSNSVPRYFSYNVTNGETGVAFMLTNLNGNVDLVVSKTPFPNLQLNSYGSFNPGSNDENILIYTNSDPVQLTPGTWYLGVFNRDITNVDYTIVVVDVPFITTLFNATPYANTNLGGIFNIDYYRFKVSTNSVRAQFEINNPSADMTLVVRKGLPPPDLTTYTYISANPGTSDELITVFKSSTPVPLSPGDWFISAANLSGGSVTYSIMATEWTDYGTNIVITNSFMSSSNSFCLTWTSLPGVHYYVQGKAGLFDPSWTNVSPTITATDYSTTWCLPLPSQYNFFRVHEGLAPGPPAPFAAPIIGSIGKSGSGVTLNWSGPTSAQFVVEWSSSLVNPNWQKFPSPVTSTTGAFSFTDDGSQSGGLAAPRFYRLVKK